MKNKGLVCMHIILLCGCGVSVPPPFGPETNRERLARKLPILPSEWMLQTNLRNQIDWVNPLFQNPSSYPPNSGRPMRGTKQVLLDGKGRRLRESDTYYSGKKHLNPGAGPGALSDQWMEIVYYFNKSSNGNIWEFHLNCGPEGSPLTLEEAESILKKWGINRLD